jgi:hypothetical protein
MQMQTCHLLSSSRQHVLLRAVPYIASACAAAAAGSATTTVCQSLETAACALWRCGHQQQSRMAAQHHQ